MLNAVVLGLGNIGMSYDFGVGSNETVATHVRAFSIHPNVNLVTAVDPDPERRRIFEEVTGKRAHPTVHSIDKEDRINLVAIATPTNEHLKSVKQAVDAFGRLQIILCEKPLHIETNLSGRIVELCDSNEVQLFVNYVRRCEPAAQEIARRIRRGEVHTPMVGVAHYVKGLRHNGSHLLDLLATWLGPIGGFEVSSVGRRLPDADMEVNVEFNFQCGRVNFINLPHEDYDVSGVELIGPNGTLRYGYDQTATWTWSRRHVGKLQESAATQVESLPFDLMRYQEYVTDCLVKESHSIPTPLCTGRQANDLVGTINRVLVQAARHV